MHCWNKTPRKDNKGFISGYIKKKTRRKLMIVETTGFHGSGHVVETMDAIIQAPSLPVKIYLDEIDKLGNYESILS